MKHIQKFEEFLNESLILNKPSYKYKGKERYILDINNQTIHVGDRVEIKKTSGGYGRTEIVDGVIKEIMAYGAFKLKGSNSPVTFKQNYDFENARKYNKYILTTTIQHGFGAMDVHAHDVYVKILEKG